MLLIAAVAVVVWIEVGGRNTVAAHTRIHPLSGLSNCGADDDFSSFSFTCLILLRCTAAVCALFCSCVCVRASCGVNLLAWFHFLPFSLPLRVGRLDSVVLVSKWAYASVCRSGSEGPPLSLLLSLFFSFPFPLRKRNSAVYIYIYIFQLDVCPRQVAGRKGLGHRVTTLTSPGRHSPSPSRSFTPPPSPLPPHAFSHYFCFTVLVLLACSSLRNCAPYTSPPSIFRSWICIHSSPVLFSTP